MLPISTKINVLMDEITFSLIKYGKYLLFQSKVMSQHWCRDQDS